MEKLKELETVFRNLMVLGSIPLRRLVVQFGHPYIPLARVKPSHAREMGQRKLKEALGLRVEAMCD